MIEFAAAVMLIAQPAALENWTVIAEADIGVVFSLDRDSIRDLGPYKQARTKSDYTKVTEGDVSVRFAVEDYDCAKRALRTRGTVAYGRDGKILRTSEFAEGETEWAAVQSGSIAEAKIDAVCAPATR